MKSKWASLDRVELPRPRPSATCGDCRGHIPINITRQPQFVLSKSSPNYQKIFIITLEQDRIIFTGSGGWQGGF